MAETSYGWAGWIARVNLTSGDITEESDVEMQKDYIGGMGFANKIMYDEVGPEVDWMDEENKVVLAVGPLTGSGRAAGGSLHLGVPVHLHHRPPRGRPCTAAASSALCSSTPATTA